MRRLNLFHLVLLTPAQTLVTLMLAAPAFYVFWLSLTTSSYGLNPQFVGLDNYINVLSDKHFWTASWNTFLIVNVVVYIELVLAFGMAVLVASLKKGRMLIFALILVPYAISEVVGVLAWRFLADPNIGLVTQAFAAFGITFNWTRNVADALTLICTISIWQHLPFTFVIIYAAVISVPRDLYEAARVDGANGWQQTWNITIPLIVPAATLAIVFRYIFAFRMFSEVWLVTKGGPVRLTEVLGTYLYRTGFTFADFGGAAATGWLMVLGALLLSVFYLRSMYRKSFSDE
ncbi:sugar ABC transporter permease [Devosia sp.]|uniref:carbohydrate ABC transporter permease n=1 Tax=Devosia sp. TaxID=1871048 RepID=UPI002AFEF5D0|nr:sugar ABC transporter permease [Devosia sp.]